jgi:diacylglycerol kinase family enzyme
MAPLRSSGSTERVPERAIASGIANCIPGKAMKLTVLVNRAAGTVVSGKITEEGLREAFRQAGAEATIEMIPGEEMAERARAAVRSGVDGIVAGGGDGTVRCVAGVVVGTGIALGVLPLGTLNHFARDLGLPEDIPEAVRALAGGEIRALDLGEVNGEVFVNTSVLGFYPTVVQDRDRQRKHAGRNKWLAAALALFRVLPRVPALHLSLTFEGKKIERKTRFVLVGNNEYSMSVFTPGTRNLFDSGNLYLYIANCPGRLCLFGLALLALVSSATRSDRFDSWCLPELTIDVHRKRKKKVPVFLDGEVLLLEPPLRYRVRARELKVLVPAVAATPASP